MAGFMMQICDPFGLQWSLQNTAAQKSWIQNALSVNTGWRKHRRHHFCKCFWPTFHKESTNIHKKSGTISIASTSSQWSMPQEVSPRIIVWGQGPRCLSHPRPPRPRGAAAGRPNQRRSPLRSEAVCRLGSRGRRPSPRAKPNRKKGRKLWEILAP